MLGQRFDVDVTVLLDVGKAAARDDVTASIDYASIHALTAAVVGAAAPRRATVEALAGGVADAVLAAHRGARAAWVRVTKPGAPIPGVFGVAGCEVRRWRA